MCGIAALVAPAGAAAPEKSTLERMISALHHRGPDGQAAELLETVGLAHARLSIIDLAGGWQPIYNEDRSVRVIFNGEIFNYVELRADLEKRGHQFSTHSDTEVIVHLYEEFGDDFVTALNGQFAIVLHDRKNRRLVLARDRVGIRPLFYATVGQQMAFASEVKALFMIPGITRALDPQGLAETLSLWSPLAPRSPFVGVQQLPPGHRMTIELSAATLAPRIESYWDWNFSDSIGASADFEQCTEELHALLVDAVRLQLRADVPVGAYLSGGLDSSIITTLIRRRTDTPLRSFSLAFEDSEYDERPYQRALVEALDSPHSEYLARRADIARAFPRAVWHAEATIVRTAPAPMMLLADHVRASGFKVVLTGEGADEVFAGYDLFKEAQVRRFLARQPDSRWRDRVLERLYPWMKNGIGRGRAFATQFFSEGQADAGKPWFAHGPRMRSTQRVRQFLDPAWASSVQSHDVEAALAATMPSAVGGWASLHQAQYVEAHTLLPGYLLSAQGDRMAMAASIEARFPFLDHRVVEFANRLPPNFKLQGLHEKLILKKAMAADLPPVITARTKQPYRSPDSASFFEQGKLLPWVEDLLQPARLQDAGVFDPSAVAKLVAKCAAGRAIGFPDNMAFVGIVSTQLLHEQFIRPATPTAWTSA